jgi:quinol monooxygenase YgiN
MDHEVSWVFEVTLKPGAHDEFTALAKEMIDANHAGEPETLNYLAFITEDGTRVHFYERFVDSAAALFHVNRFGENFGDRLPRLADVTRFDIYGDPSEELKRALADFAPTYLGLIGGFTR